MVSYFVDHSPELVLGSFFVTNGIEEFACDTDIQNNQTFNSEGFIL